VDKRSDVRVSKYASDINANAWRVVYSPGHRYARHPSLRFAERGKRFRTLRVWNPSLWMEWD